MEDKFLYQQKVFRERRRELRNSSTEVEKILWQYLKGSKLGVKFTRQYSVGPYILDFYCPKLRLAIELDGKQHKESTNILYDKDREDYLKTVDIETIRFWNQDIVNSLDKSLEKIQIKISNMAPPS